MRVLHLDQVGGLSGDMFLGALAGLGADLSRMEAALAGLRAGEIRLEASAVERGGFPATFVRVIAPEEGDHPHRSFTAIARMISESSLPPAVIDNAVRVFRNLGEAEARVHGVPLEAIHFHEVGALDSIADIVGVCWALNDLGIDRIVSSPFLLGRGRIRMAHGVWPAPAPAVLELIQGFPVRLTELDGETVTPTGAALVVTLADRSLEEMPMTFLRSAAGAGSREWPDRPNVLRAYLGDSGTPGNTDEVEVLEAAIDDMTPEVAGHVASMLLQAGALDVIITPALMKKGRPGFLFTVLARPGEGEAAGDLLFRETTTLGLRFRRETRRVLERRTVAVATPWGELSVKVATLPDGGLRVSPEFEECARVAREKQLPLIEVMETVRAAALRSLL